MEITIYDLELHQKKRISDATIVIRVPGGWLYVTTTKVSNGLNLTSMSTASVFVPYNTEFKKYKKFKDEDNLG